MEQVIRFIRRALFASAAMLVVSFSHIFSSTAHAQGLTSMGIDYWIGFMPNYLQPAENLRLFIASPTINLVDVEIYGGADQPSHQIVTMDDGTVATIEIPYPEFAETWLPEVPDYRAVHVHSIAPISVYGLSNSTYTSDGYLALPRHALDEAYYSVCFYDDQYVIDQPPMPLAGEFLIVAPHDSTVITIHNVTADTRTNTDGTVSHAKGDTWSATLMRGQTYLVQSTGTTYGKQDLTGTLVTGTKPFSFLSGHQRASVPIGAPNDSKNHLIEMIPPTNRWGTRYFDQPTPYRTIGDKIRLIAGEDGVVIAANGTAVTTLTHAGDWIDQEEVTTPTVYESNGKRFLAVQYAYTQGYHGDSTLSDPFMIVLPSEAQFQKRIYFRTPSNDSYMGRPYTHYLTVIGTQDALPNVRINGNALQNFDQATITPFPNSPMASLTCTIPEQEVGLLLESDVPVGAWASGRSYVDGYGWPVGMLLNLESDDLQKPAVRIDGFEKNALALSVSDKGEKSVGLAAIELIANANDLRYQSGSTNVKLESDQDLVSGSESYSCKLALIDSSKSGDATVWAIDKSGNETVEKYHIAASMSAVQPETQPIQTMSILPNPAASHVTLTLPSTATTVRALSLYDMTGRAIKQFEPNATALDVSDVANGSYTLQMTSSSGVAALKLIVRH